MIDVCKLRKPVPFSGHKKKITFNRNKENKNLALPLTLSKKL